MSQPTTGSSSNVVSDPNTLEWPPTLHSLSYAPEGTISARLAPRRSHDNPNLVPNISAEKMGTYQVFLATGIDVENMPAGRRCRCAVEDDTRKCVSCACYLITYEAGTSLAREFTNGQGTQVFEVDQEREALLHNKDYKLHLVNFSGCQWLVDESLKPPTFSTDSSSAEEGNSDAVNDNSSVGGGVLRVVNGSSSDANGSPPAANGDGHNGVSSPSSDEGLWMSETRRRA